MWRSVSWNQALVPKLLRQCTLKNTRKMTPFSGRRLRARLQITVSALFTIRHSSPPPNQYLHTEDGRLPAPKITPAFLSCAKEVGAEPELETLSPVHVDPSGESASPLQFMMF